MASYSDSAAAVRTPKDAHLPDPALLPVHAPPVVVARAVVPRPVPSSTPIAPTISSDAPRLPPQLPAQPQRVASLGGSPSCIGSDAAVVDVLYPRHLPSEGAQSARSDAASAVDEDEDVDEDHSHTDAAFFRGDDDELQVHDPGRWDADIGRLPGALQASNAGPIVPMYDDAGAETGSLLRYDTFSTQHCCSLRLSLILAKCYVSL